MTRPIRGSGYCSSPFRAGNLVIGIAAVSPAPQPNAAYYTKTAAPKSSTAVQRDARHFVLFPKCPELQLSTCKRVSRLRCLVCDHT